MRLLLTPQLTSVPAVTAEDWCYFTSFSAWICFLRPCSDFLGYNILLQNVHCLCSGSRTVPSDALWIWRGSWPKLLQLKLLPVWLECLMLSLIYFLDLRALAELMVLSWGNCDVSLVFRKTVDSEVSILCAYFTQGRYQVAGLCAVMQQKADSSSWFRLSVWLFDWGCGWLWPRRRCRMISILARQTGGFYWRQFLMGFHEV